MSYTDHNQLQPANVSLAYQLIAMIFYYNSALQVAAQAYKGTTEELSKRVAVPQLFSGFK